jgi:YfiR/HmsC-like
MTHFINWPENLNLDSDISDFTICLQGPKKYFHGFEKWAQDGNIKNRSVTLQYINDNSSQLSNCHILYITDNSHLNSYLEAAQKEKFLTISDTPGNCLRGVIINFFTVNNRLRFEINYDVANDLGFKINPKLLKLAKIITSKRIKR